MATETQIERGNKIIAEYQEWLTVAKKLDDEIETLPEKKTKTQRRKLTSVEYRLGKLDTYATLLAMQMGREAWNKLFTGHLAGMLDVINYDELREYYVGTLNKGLPFP